MLGNKNADWQAKIPKDGVCISITGLLSGTWRQVLVSY